jgi:hypothetical protein
MQVYEQFKRDAEAYSAKINLSTKEVNKIMDQMENNLDDAGAARLAGFQDDAIKLKQLNLAIACITAANAARLADDAQRIRDIAVNNAARPENSSDIIYLQAAIGANNAYQEALKFQHAKSQEIQTRVEVLRGVDKTTGTVYNDAPPPLSPEFLPDLGTEARNAAIKAALDAARSAGENVSQSVAEAAAMVAAQAAAKVSGEAAQQSAQSAAGNAASSAGSSGGGGSPPIHWCPPMH